MSNNDISDDDKALFHQAVKTAKPLKNSKTITSAKKQQLTKLQKSSLPDPSLTSTSKVPIEFELIMHLSNFYAEEVDSYTLLSFCRHTIPSKRLHMLKQGRIAWDAKLDLHGLTPDAAQKSFIKFIVREIALKHRCLLIIHGKGSRHGEAPVLKNLVNQWLRQIPQVLAFHSALPKEGGSGALYVLLKRNQDRDTQRLNFIE